MTNATDPPARGDDSGRRSAGLEGLELSRAAGFLWRQRVPVLVGVVLAALATVLVIVLAVDPRYQAEATVVVIPAQIASDLAPQTLTIYGYRTLLESDAVVAETQKALVEEGLLTAEDKLEIGEQLASRIFVSSRRESESLAPLLELVARSKSSETAAAIANRWARSFLRLAKEISVGTTTANVGFVREQYPRTDAELGEAETERRRVADEFDDRQVELVARWGRRLAAARRESADQMASFQTETRELIAGALQGVEARLLAEHPEAGEGAIGSAVGLLYQLAAARTLLAQSSPTVTLERGISDEALWQSLVLESEAPNVESWGELRLSSEEVDPSYAELAGRVAALEGELKRAAAAAGLGALEEVGARVEQLQQTRAAGRRGLEVDRDLALESLRRRKGAELAQLDRERDDRLRVLDRRIRQLRDLDQQLEKSYNEAVLAGAQETVDELRLVAPAVPPASPLSRRLPLRVALAAMIGGVIGLGFGFVRELGAGS